jgi:hypothetical protein
MSQINLFTQNYCVFDSIAALYSKNTKEHSVSETVSASVLRRGLGDT